MKTLGVDVPKLIKSTQHLQFYAHLELEPGAFFDRETFGTDKLIVGIDKATLAHALGQAPYPRRLAIKSSNSSTTRISI